MTEKQYIQLIMCTVLVIIGFVTAWQGAIFIFLAWWIYNALEEKG